MSSPLLKNFPSINELLENPQLKRLMDRVSRNAVVTGARSVLENLRSEVQQAAAEIKVPSVSELADQIASWVQRSEAASLRPVINATGRLLDPNFGPPPLADEAIGAMAEAARGFVAISQAPGESPPRPTAAAEHLLAKLTGAEGAVAVNSQAGATILSLASLAEGKEVIVSRGQIGTSGDGVRLHDLARAAGVRLREIGSTNIARLSDYESVITVETGALVRMRPLDYSVTGRTEQPELADLVSLGRRHRVPVIDLLSSASLVELDKFGVRGEPVVSDSVRDGADVVVFGGDQWLGGPQCGLAVGRREAIAKLAAHARQTALRLDKLRHAALAATLGLYHDTVAPELTVPILALVGTSLENLRNRAERISPQLAATSKVSAVEIREGVSQLGQFSSPSSSLSRELRTWLIAVMPRDLSANELAARLRQGSPAVVANVVDDRVVIDLRSVAPKQDLQLVAAFANLDPASSEDASH